MQYEEIQNRKLISSYGGVGSIIETRKGAVIIEPFNKWPFFETKEAYKPKYYIADERFKARLTLHFTELKQLIRLPENQLKQGFAPENMKKLVSASYFPKWMYCASCHTFKHYDDWKKKWNTEIANNFDKENFNPPKCYKCYLDEKKKHKFYDLEQVRFVMTSPSGNIADIPWVHWTLRNNIKNTKTINGKTNDNDKNEQPEDNQNILDIKSFGNTDDISLKYITSARFGDLKGIFIEAYRGNTRIATTTLAGLFNLRIWENQHHFEKLFGKSQLKVVLRSSNSIYYPNISQSIYLPVENIVGNEILEEIKNLHNDNLNAQQITNIINRQFLINRNNDFIKTIIENDFQPTINPALSEELYRLEEYNFITTKNKFREDDFIFQKIPDEYYNIGQIENIYRIDRLRVTSVQTAFTRQKPIDKDAFLEKELEGEILRKYTSTYREKAWYLPAYESYGEGIFIEINQELLSNWETNSEVKERANFLQTNFNNSFLGQSRDKNISPRFILIHTISHLLIKELEFLCGYPAASLQERLYINNEMQGVLIYTVAGAEGSFGGLVSLCKSKSIGELIKSALHRAKDCASDPICYQTDKQGQGTAGLNLAACYSCALLPETSCEEFNSFLDRKLVIGEIIGFMIDENKKESPYHQA